MAKPLNNTDPVEVPLLAAAVLSQAGATNSEAQELLLDILREVKGKRDAEREKAERLAKAAVEATREADEQRKRVQAGCNHRKQDNVSTRLVGQRVTGTGQLVMTCQWCNKMFHNPPDLSQGQEAAPRELLPHGDLIGG